MAGARFKNLPVHWPLKILQFFGCSMQMVQQLIMCYSLFILDSFPANSQKTKMLEKLNLNFTMSVCPYSQNHSGTAEGIFRTFRVNTLTRHRHILIYVKIGQRVLRVSLANFLVRVKNTLNRRCREKCDILHPTLFFH